MHTYPSYHAPNGQALVDFVARTPFALAVTSQQGAPIATHVPVVLPPSFVGRRDGEAPLETLVGTTLWSHMGRANRHWRLMERDPDVLLVHASSHGYVSPTLYRTEPAVPTVDYAAVHLTGTVRLIDSDEEALEVVRQTVRQLEGERQPAWDMGGSLELFRSILHGIKAFVVEVTAEQSVFKLSQDKSAAIRARVRDEFAGDAPSSIPGCPHADLAAIMDVLPKERVRRGHYPPLEER